MAVTIFEIWIYLLLNSGVFGIWEVSCNTFVVIRVAIRLRLVLELLAIFARLRAVFLNSQLFLLNCR